MTRTGASASPPDVNGAGIRVGIIAARFNDHIVVALRDGALRALARVGVADSDIIEIWVPGAFEVPLAALTLAESAKVDAVICLGAVIRGDTAHFDFVAGQAARGIQDAQLTTGIPIMFGVLTVENEQQAIDRSGPGLDNKGDEAALGAIEMVHILRRLLD
ncbi:MAG: 6,7-dimethyl-8-ribityllumazine synthase [Actinobacteria bacterium]|nr:6,7-dimethyl-8-ribityllumazine synthase [Actinomycetota bacterium]